MAPLNIRGTRHLYPQKTTLRFGVLPAYSFTAWTLERVDASRRDLGYPARRYEYIPTAQTAIANFWMTCTHPTNNGTAPFLGQHILADDPLREVGHATGILFTTTTLQHYVRRGGGDDLKRSTRAPRAQGLPVSFPPRQYLYRGLPSAHVVPRAATPLTITGNT